MHKTNRRLLPLNSLRAFEAAVRQGSITRAVEEPGVTQRAFSHQFRSLYGTVRSKWLEPCRAAALRQGIIKRSPLRYFKTSPEIIRLAVMMYIRFPLSLRNVEDLLHERGIDICHETVRFWWHRFGPMFAAEIRKRRVSGMQSSHWR